MPLHKPRLSCYLTRGPCSPPPLPTLQALDRYLKEERVRFRELFSHFDTDRSGHLDGRELGRLARKLVPGATEAQVEYFQVR